MDRSQLEQLQLQRLRDIVGYALKTPFYQKRLAKAWIHSPDDIKTLADLRKIPSPSKTIFARVTQSCWLSIWNRSSESIPPAARPVCPR
jgi:phenylacetate-coenzyme A ligase PaaK-like adenylate-forming protein